MINQQSNGKSPPLLVYLHANTPKDRNWCNDLMKQLYTKEHTNQLRQWHPDHILAGSQVQNEFEMQLAQATVVLVLLSPDLPSDALFQVFLDWQQDMSRTTVPHVIPILLRETTDWDDLFGDLQVLPRNKKPLDLWTKRETACAQVSRELLLLLPSISSNEQEVRQQEKEAYFTNFLVDSPAFINDRLSRFVGRDKERATIRQHIAELQPTGGFLIITGSAGQGKSSILAMLVEEMGREQVAHHFIPYTPGTQHQVELLQNLIARLALKHHFSDIDLTNRTYPALRSTFHRLLKKIAAGGETTILVIDGLDQLETEHTGWRDLSFLPPDPSHGVVFVLGTRPDDTLKPLALVKPCFFYALPEMSQPDFACLLQKQDLFLGKDTIDRYYRALGGHAFYLDLAARLLVEQGVLTFKEVITQVEKNPDNLLWLSLERLKQPAEEWGVVMKPILGVLLETREPLSVSALSQIIGIDDEDRLSQNLSRLRGLLLQDNYRRWTLFHLKLYEYLHHDPKIADQVSLFSTKEERFWHRKLAHWCEQKSLETIWEDAKYLEEQECRMYARRHYITHLAGAQEWQRLFSVLDSGQYGRAKIRKHDPSTQAYARDLDMGKQAALEAEETFEGGLNQLPRLWRYTLLRCSLASRADRYPVSAFGLLILFDRQQEALGLAELVADPTKQVEIFCELAKQVKKQALLPEQSLTLLKRAGEIVEKVPKRIRAGALRELGTALAQAGAWDQAERVCGTISDEGQRTEALHKLGTALTQAGEREQAERVYGAIPDERQRAESLCELGRKAAEKGEYTFLLHLVQQAWLTVETRASAFLFFATATTLFVSQPSLALACCDEFQFVDQFLG